MTESNALHETDAAYDELQAAYENPHEAEWLARYGSNLKVSLAWVELVSAGMSPSALKQLLQDVETDYHRQVKVALAKEKVVPNSPPASASIDRYTNELKKVQDYIGKRVNADQSNTLLKEIDEITAVSEGAISDIEARYANPHAVEWKERYGENIVVSMSWAKFMVDRMKNGTRKRLLKDLETEYTRLVNIAKAKAAYGSSTQGEIDHYTNEMQEIRAYIRKKVRNKRIVSSITTFVLAVIGAWLWVNYGEEIKKFALAFLGLSVITLFFYGLGEVDSYNPYIKKKRE